MDPRVHQARPHHGQSLVAERITSIMQDSDILQSHAGCDKVQDAYSFRCIPQVHGPVLENYRKMCSTLDIEINSATDNPLIFPDPKNQGKNEVISQGNFHGEVLAITADNMSHSLFELAHISERRIDQMVDPTRSGLPPFLAKNSGLESGMMIVHYVAAAAQLKCMQGLCRAQHFLLLHQGAKRTMFRWVQQQPGISLTRVIFYLRY